MLRRRGGIHCYRGVDAKCAPRVPRSTLQQMVLRSGQHVPQMSLPWYTVHSSGGARQPMILLGPVAVAAAREGQGIASTLMRASLAALDAADSPPVLLIGDAPFYGRFGFSAAATRHWELPGPVDHDRLLLRGPTTGLPRIAWVEAASGNPPRTAKVA